MTATREEHMDWCKQRALAYVDRGELHNAFNSLATDLSKHPETRDHAAIELGMMRLVAGQLETEAEMRRFIEGMR